MLDEFARDVLRNIDEQRSVQVEKLIAAEGSARHDYIRGAILTLDGVRASVTALVAAYSDVKPAPEDERVQRFRQYRMGA